MIHHRFWFPVALTKVPTDIQYCKWRTHLQTLNKHLSFTLYNYFLTFFDLFQKIRQMRPDLPDTSVTKITIVTVSLRDLWRIMIERHTLKVPIVQTATANHSPGADELPQNSPNGIFCFHGVLMGTTPTRQGTEAGPLFMDIMQNNEEECWEISDWN